MRKLIEDIVNGDDDKFADLLKAVIAGKIFVFAQSEDEEGLTLNFLNYLLEDDNTIEYIPLFTDQEEVDEFVAEADVPDGYSLYEFDGDLFADLMDEEQYLMVNPCTGGIIFQGAHFKAAEPSDGEETEEDAE